MLKSLLFILLPVLAFSQDDVYITAPITKTPDSLIEKYYSKGFEPGEIIFPNNSVKSGLIKFNGSLFYKETEQGKRERYKPSDLKSFIVHRDTFITARNLEYTYQNMSGYSHTDIEFVKQLLIGKVNLYEFKVRAGTATPGIFSYVSNYYLNKGQGSDFVLIPHKKKKFIEVLSTFIADDLKLVTAIKDGVFTYDDLRSIVKQYNTN